MMLRLMLFVAILTSITGLETWDLDHTQFQAPWNVALARLSEKAILLMNGSVIRTGNELIDPASQKSIVILGGCNGFEVTFMLVTAMLVYPSCWRAKTLGVVTGIFAVQSLNILRLVCLFYLNLWDEEFFRFAHLYLWQSLIMLDVLFILLLWLRWQKGLCKSL